MTGWNVRLLDIVHINMYVLRYAILVVEFKEKTKDYVSEVKLGLILKKVVKKSQKLLKKLLRKCQN